MICESCKTKPVAKGIKSVFCYRCDTEILINVEYINLCHKCSKELGICQYCGN